MAPGCDGRFSDRRTLGSRKRNHATRAVDAAGRLGSRTIQSFQSVDVDGDGVPDKPRALSAVDNAGSKISGAAGAAAQAATGAAGAAANAAAGAAANVADAASGVAGKIGSLFRRKPDKVSAREQPDPAPVPEQN